MSLGIEQAITRALFHFVWEGAAIAALLAAALWIGRRASSQARYAMACAAMAGMVTVFVGTLAWLWPHASPAGEMTIAVPRAVFVNGVVPARATEAAPARWVSPAWAAPIWMLGVAMFSLRSLAAWLAAMRLRRVGTRVAGSNWQERFKALVSMIRLSRQVALLESCMVDVPMVIGWLKPVILVPASLLTGFPAEQLELILLHELEHIRRHDYLVNLLQSVVENVLFYHPAVWWVSAVMRAEREHCCDDAVVMARGDARGFAAALAALEESRWSAYETALAANGGHLMGRILRLLNRRSSSGMVAGPAFTAGLLAAGIALMVMMGHAQDATPRVLQAAPAAPEPPQASRAAQIPMYPPATEVPEHYRKWVNEDVYWIITPQERQAFLGLKSDDERKQFIDQFWLKRDPTPGTPQNEYEEEVYGRLAYANENFSSGSVPGWKTDRGMVYIKYGRPDERDEHPSGGTYQRPIEEGGGMTSTYPFEKWRYRFIPGVGKDVTLEFVDTTLNGDYRMTTDPATKDALLYVPGAGLTFYEQIGLSEKNDRFTRTDGTRLGTGTMPLPDAPKCTLDEVNRVLNCQIPVPRTPQK